MSRKTFFTLGLGRETVYPLVNERGSVFVRGDGPWRFPHGFRHRCRPEFCRSMLNWYCSFGELPCFVPLHWTLYTFQQVRGPLDISRENLSRFFSARWIGQGAVHRSTATRTKARFFSLKRDWKMRPGPWEKPLPRLKARTDPGWRSIGWNFCTRDDHARTTCFVLLSTSLGEKSERASSSLGPPMRGRATTISLTPLFFYSSRLFTQLSSYSSRAETTKLELVRGKNNAAHFHHSVLSRIRISSPLLFLVYRNQATKRQLANSSISSGVSTSY